jgi:hypothetical protein
VRHRRRREGRRRGLGSLARDWAAEQRWFLEAIAPESHVHRAFDGPGDAFFFAKNLAGETLFFSRGILPHIGLESYEQMLGATDEELTPGPSAAHYRVDDRIVIESKQPLIGHVDVWFDEVGLRDWYETNEHPILDRADRVIGVMGTLRQKCTAGLGVESTLGRRLLLRNGLSGRRCRTPLPSAGVPEAVAFALRLEDVAAVRQPVEGRSRNMP